MAGLISVLLSFLLYIVLTDYALSSSLRASADNRLQYVKDSGICETVAGVGQYSGYIDVGDENYFWFWFFESRSRPNTDPLNGGPGCSSMIGLWGKGSPVRFKLVRLESHSSKDPETGPCTVDTDGESTSLNPYSWNNYSNILYLDQPFGAGFSTGKTLTNTSAAATYVWQAFQVLFSSNEFSQYRDRHFVLATESYGARFGPVFINYFDSQNKLIDDGELDGVKVIVSSLMISNGKHDPLINFQSLITFAKNAPSYGALVNQSVITAVTTFFEDTCSESLWDCYSADISNNSAQDACNAAMISCTTDVMEPLVGDRDPDYLLAFPDSTDDEEDEDATPSTSYAAYLRQQQIQDAIGATLINARPSFDQCDATTHALFSRSGETARSFLPELAELADSGFHILIWGGDADMKANWLGLLQSMIEMNWYGNQTLNNTELRNMTIDGEDVASYAVVDSFTFARVFGAGHTLPAYKPQVAQVVFRQFVSNETIHSVISSSPDAGPSSSPNSVKSEHFNDRSYLNYNNLPNLAGFKPRMKLYGRRDPHDDVVAYTNMKRLLYTMRFPLTHFRANLGLRGIRGKLAQSCSYYPFTSLREDFFSRNSKPWQEMQCRGIRTKPEAPRITLPSDGPTPDEELVLQRMLEQREMNILRVAKEKNWFSPSNYENTPEGWSYEWADWVAGWELVPIVSRSHADLILEHYFGMAGRFTPIIFRMDPFAPDFIFRYEGMNAQDEDRKGSSWIDQGSSGAYYHYRMGDDGLSRFPNDFDNCSSREFLSACIGSGLENIEKGLSVVPELPGSDASSNAFAEDCDLELIHFEQRLAGLESEGKAKPEAIVALGADGAADEPLYPITSEKVQALRERYQSYKAYGVHSVYSFLSDDTTTRSHARRKETNYLDEVDDLQSRIQDLKQELHEIEDDEGEFEVVKPQKQGRRRKTRPN
ncbi:hypothetical protein D9757_004702 [Collybiopsis confluens]|uniref:Carboxypeptidase n=1 Tax=Collybiopsis confluens TaxID=2823264 RepID=A0A8H5MCA1_9AGAR|nr:hypothetical protein D9757_004702 [Collybiopsis confluens]